MQAKLPNYTNQNEQQTTNKEQPNPKLKQTNDI